MKKVVILYSTSGFGHLNSAKAIMQAFDRRGADVDIRFINILDHGNKFFEFLHFKFYVTLMKYAKWLWGFFYYLSDLPVFDILVRALRHISDHKSWKGLEELLKKEKPDAVIATHFFLTSVARAIKSNKELSSRLYLMVSGYGTHNIWASKHIDHFFTGIKEVSDGLIRRGIDASRITVTGMPVPEDFMRSYDNNSLKEKYGLDGSKKTIFMLSGAFGAAPMETILKELNNCRADIQVITVCGHNEAAFRNIDKMRDSLCFSVKLFGFTDKIAELMSVSDLMISKAGTMSVAQALNMFLPMIIFYYIPGHETPTVRLLQEKGAAKVAFSVKDIPGLVDRALLSDDDYKKMIDGIERIRCPRAADDIIDVILKELGVRC